MLNIADINFLMGVMDKATIQGLQANKMMVEVAIKLTAYQEELQNEALEALKGPEKGKEPVDPKEDGKDEGSDNGEAVVPE